jgi:putative oxidoreductase
MKTINQLIISHSNYAAPAGRVLIAFMFVMSGLNKMNNYSNTAGWMDAMGVPGSLLPLVIVLEVLGGAAIMIGWQTRIAAILFAAFSVMSAAIFHADLSDQNQMIHFMKNVSIAGGFLFLIVHGAGNYSLDSREKARQR